MASSHTRRSVGEGSVYQQADGRWRASYVVTHPVTGARSRRVLSGRTKGEAVRKLEALKKDATGTYGGETVAAYLARWLVAGRDNVRPSTWRQRDQYIRSYMVPAVGAIPLARLAPLDVERMTGALVASGRSSSTAAGVRVILRRALADALRDGLVARNVAALARPPRRVQRDIEYLDVPALRRLFDVAEQHRLGPLVILAATTGLRQGELLGLKWTDVDLEAGTVAVRRAMARARDGGWELAETKTPRSRRTVSLARRAAEALRLQQTRQDDESAAAGSAWQDVDGLVFTDTIGRPLVGWNVTRIFGALVEAAGLPHVAFHALRHTAATTLLSAGVPLRVVADVLGHSTIVVTANTYTAVVPELRREAADAIDRALG